jgi:tripartite-type tricarboxylate transporter receptor subunit TctC
MNEGGEVLGGTPEQFSSLLAKDTAHWGKIIKASGIKLD